MRIVQLLPGTCGVFYCENCIRDLDLGAALGRAGHTVESVPLYLPLTADASDSAAGQPIFFGGINTYLRERSGFFRSAPRWLGRWLDARWLLRIASRKAELTSARDLGAATCSMLAGEHGHQAKELERLVAWLGSRERPDIACLSNILLAGLAPRLREALRIPIVCLLQDEDGFLDDLPEPYRERAWAAVVERAAAVDGFIAVSASYRDRMVERLRLPRDRVHVVHSGLDLDGYGPAEAPPDPPVLGFLSPALPDKGLDRLIEAFAIVRRNPALAGLRLRIWGGTTAGSHPFVETVREKIEAGGGGEAVEFLPNLGRGPRQEFLRSLSVLSVPTARGEAFGMYVLEAAASGVPVVEPRHGALPELVEGTGGGILVEPDDTTALAGALEELLLHPDEARALGERGRRGVRERFAVDKTAQVFAETLARIAEQT